MLNVINSILKESSVEIQLDNRHMMIRGENVNPL